MWEKEERTCWESRRHAIVLAKPLARSLALGIAGFAAFAAGWPVMVAAPILVAVGGVSAGVAVWRWERTKVVVTTEQLFVVYGTFGRRAAAVRLARIPAIEVDQTVLGRVIGYGTLVAGELEIRYVPQPRHAATLVARLGA